MDNKKKTIRADSRFKKHIFKCSTSSCINTYTTTHTIYKHVHAVLIREQFAMHKQKHLLVQNTVFYSTFVLVHAHEYTHAHTQTGP